MENPTLQLEPLRPPANPARWVRYGTVSGCLGLVFVPIILGPVAIYFGARALKETTPNSGKRKLAPVLVIGLGVFDIFLRLILIIGTIRLMGTQD